VIPPLEEKRILAGALARLTGVSSDTLRHYEKVGVLPKPPRTASGYRQYPESAVQRVRMVRRAMAIGFTLEELARVLQTRDRGGAPCRRVRELAASKLENVEEQLVEMTLLRDQLRTLLETWDNRLAQTPPGERALLLEFLDARRDE
jgi:MerR family copper efflux transcriptional regulator